MTNDLNQFALINKDNFSTEWEIVDPAGITSSWSFSPQNILKQTVSVGSTKNGSGTFAIHKSPVTSDSTEVRLNCFPGTSYQVGMAICYSDQNNYIIFSVEQLSKSNKGYYILVVESKNGVVTNLLKKLVNTELSDSVLFVAKQEGGDVILHFGDESVFTLSGKSLRDKRLGLYNQRNTDALFHEFTMSTAITALDVMTPSPVVLSSNINTPSTNFVPAPRLIEENNIIPFLKIKEPNTLSLIEFKEPFRVSLDSLYSSLYLNSELARPKEMQYSTKPTHSQLLDIRPKRWYKEYKNIKDALRLAQFDLTRATTMLNTIENGGVYPNDVDNEKHDVAIRDARKKYLIYQDVIEKLNQERNNLFHEMRIAGYLVRNENVPKEIIELGYDFYIAGGVVGYKDYDPIDVNPFFEMSDDPKWAELETKLRERLFANTRFSAGSKERYLSKVEFLKSYDQYLPQIQKDLDALSNEIIVLENTIPQQEKQVENILQEIKNWKADRKVLEDERINFRPYNSDEYWTREVRGHDQRMESAGSQNNENFKNWLSDHAFIFKSFNYKFNISGRNYSVSIDRYEGFNWYQDYQFSYEINNDAEWRFGWPNMILAATNRWIHTYKSTFIGEKDIRTFFDKAIQICDTFIDQYLPIEIASLQTKIAILKNNIIGVELRKKDIELNALSVARESFVDEWNRASIMDITAVGEKVVNPNSDPLTDLIADLSTEGESAKVYNVEFRSDGYYAQDGQSLLDFMDLVDKLPHIPILLLPVFDRYGKKLTEVWNAVVNPMRSSNIVKLPTITFVETYKTEVRWKGYCIGELTQTVNLFPGEKKEMVIEHSTKLSEKLSKTEASETSKSTTVTNSFEQQLQKELSEKNEMAWEASVTDENERKQEVSQIITSELNKVNDLSLKISGQLDSGSNENPNQTNSNNQGGQQNSTSNRNNTQSTTLGVTDNKKTSNKKTDEKTNSLIISQKQVSEKSNKESKETLNKSVSNLINKAASETSENNKVSFTSSKSTEFEETTSKKETIVLENPNIGRTINYNFFQIQNTFETKTTMIDVKIVLDPGIEMIKYSDLTDLRVFDLEEFSRLYFNSDAKDPKIALLAGIVARQVFKTYCNMGGNSNANEVIQFTGVVPMDEEMYNILNLSFPWESGDSLQDSLIDPLRKALTYLKSVSLKFNEVELIKPVLHTVNTGSYYMDSEVGIQPATEKYLEDRRDIQTEKQRAEVEEIRARIKGGVFHQPLPAGLTTLNLNNNEKQVELTTNGQLK